VSIDTTFHPLTETAVIDNTAAAQIKQAGQRGVTTFRGARHGILRVRRLRAGVDGGGARRPRRGRAAQLRRLNRCHQHSGQQHRLP
jgi:hypothetical protein